MKNFLIIDDHAIVRAGLNMTLHRMYPTAIIDHAENERKSIALINEKNFDLVFMDLNMPGSDATSLIYYILKKNPATNIIVLTMNDENVYAKRFYKLGIKGFLNKSVDDDIIGKAIRTVMDGQIFISESLKIFLSESSLIGNAENPFDNLSEREFQVARELIKGKSIAEISSTLNIHSSTVSTYKTKIFEKLMIPQYNIAELIATARTHNII